MFMMTALAVQAAAQPVPTVLTLPAVIDAAAKLCQQAVTTGQPHIPASAQLYMNMYREAGGIKPFEQVPALVKRFAATQPGGRVGPVSGYVTWPQSAGGSVWVVMYQTSGCDILVTGVTDVSVVAVPFVRSLESAGFSILRSIDASSSQPLSQRLFLKRQPTATAPAYGTRISVAWPTGAASKPDGVQMTVSYLAGDIAKPSTSVIAQGQ